MKTRTNHQALVLAVALGAALGTGNAQAQAILEVGGAGTIGDTSLATSGGVAKVPATGTNWRAPGGNGNTFSSLVSPTKTVLNGGTVTLTFTHRYDFEADYDGGAVYVNVNGGGFVKVPLASFTSNGYNDTMSNATVWPLDEEVFTGQSTDYSVSTLITSVANLGSLAAGDTVAVEFRGGWDTNTNGANPNWEIGSVNISDPGATLLAANFTADGAAGFTSSTTGTGSSPWTYLKPVSRFELNADTLTADRYAPDVAGSVIDLNGANLQVVLLTGTIDIGDTFHLFDLTGGTTITGAPGQLTLPPGAWDTSKLAVDGTITLRLLPPLVTPGADFEVNARLDRDGDSIWEDQIGKAGIEFFLDTAGGVSRVATSSSTRIGYAYDFPGGLPGGASAEAGVGGAKLVRTGDASGECYSFQDGPLPSGGWDVQNVTIEIWFKPDSLTPANAANTNGQILYEDGGGTGIGLFLANGVLVSSQDGNQAQISYNLSTDPSSLLIGPATTEFIQCVVTRTAPGITGMFINGKSVGTSNDGDGDWTGGDGFGLGARGEANVGGRGGGDSSTESFNGQIALFRVYNNQILTAAEVANNFGDLYGPNDPYMAVTLASPFNNQAWLSGTPVVASATLEDPGTAPYTVEFWVDGTLAGTATTTEPYTRNLGVLADGSHQIYAKFIDSSTPNHLVATTATHAFTVAPATTTTTTLASSANPSIYGAATVTATVVAANSTQLTGGTVQFYDGGSPLGSPVAVDTATGKASLSINTLGVGTHAITADYSGWGVHAASSSAALSQVVNLAPLTVTANNVFRPTGTANLDPLPYKITGYQNGETRATSGVSGEPLLTTAADSASPAGNYPITCALGDLAADNYSFTLVNGTLTVADVPDTFSVNFYVGPDWPYGGLTTDEQKENIKVQPGMPAGFGDWFTNGWLNYLVPWAPTSPQAPVTLTSNRGSTATFQLKDCRNGWTYNLARTTLLGDGNGNMMDGHVNSTLDPGDGSNLFDMEVSNIPFAVYDVIFYIGANLAQFGDGKGVIVFNGGPERAFTIKPGAFDGTFTEMVDETTPGNYIVFKGVTGSSFTTKTWGTGPTGFNHLGPFGFQVRPAPTDYTTWAARYPGADLSDPNGDHDGDGLSNDDERLFGLDPTSPTSVSPIAGMLDAAAGTFSFTRRDDALTRKFSSVETSADLVLWTKDDGAVLTPGTPDANGVETVAVTLSPGLLSAPKLFVRVVQDDGVIFSANFEDDNGGFAPGGAPNDWEWGTPNSNNTVDLTVTAGNGGSAKCWATKLGDGAASSGFITAGANSILRGPNAATTGINLAGVTAAELQFAAAVDATAGDTLEVLVKEVGTGATLVTVPATELAPPVTADWAGYGPYDISAAAGKSVYLEFRFVGSDGSYIGLYLDDVTVKKVVVP